MVGEDGVYTFNLTYGHFGKPNLPWEKIEKLN